MERLLLTHWRPFFNRICLIAPLAFMFLFMQTADAFVSEGMVFSTIKADIYLPKVHDTSRDEIIERVEIEASFPGGDQGWATYISEQIMSNFGKLTKKDYGTCMIRFVVSKTGKVTNVKAETMKKSQLAKIAIKAIKDGPDWIPAQQDGKFVNAFRIQPVTLTDPDAKPSEPVDPEKVYTNPDKAAEFPGGASQWQKFVTAVIRKNIDEFSQKDAGICELTFIVDAKGHLSDIRATRMEGSKLANAMMEALKAGPRWIPAEVGGQKVKSERSMPVTFRL